MLHCAGGAADLHGVADRISQAGVCACWNFHRSCYFQINFWILPIAQFLLVGAQRGGPFCLHFNKSLRFSISITMLPKANYPREIGVDIWCRTPFSPAPLKWHRAKFCLWLLNLFRSSRWTWWLAGLEPEPFEHWSVTWFGVQ